LNPRPSVPQTDALPTELRSPLLNLKQFSTIFPRPLLFAIGGSESTMCARNSGLACSEPPVFKKPCSQRARKLLIRLGRIRRTLAFIDLPFFDGKVAGKSEEYSLRIAGRLPRPSRSPRLLRQEALALGELICDRFELDSY
jgi:hypothetical protein